MNLKFYGIFLCAVLGVLTLTAEEKLILESDFRNPVAKKIYASALPSLEKKGLVPAELEKLPLPKDLLMDWGTFPADGAFECRKDGFWLCTATKLIVYGPYLNVVGKKVRMELTLMNPNDNQAEIDFGVHEYMLKPGAHSLTKIKLKNHESKTLCFEFSSLEQFSVVVPRIAIQGEAVLQKLKIYTKDDPDMTILEGEIVERSVLPDPKKSDYPDCRFTVHFRGNSILSGPACNEELSLVIDGFRDYRLLSSDKLEVGDKICCAILPFDDLPDEKKTTQQADDLNLFTLDNYYVAAVSKITRFSDEKLFPMSGISFTGANDNYVSIFERHINPPIPEALVTAQQAQIAADLAKMNQLLDGLESQKDELNQKFKVAWEIEKAKDAPGYNRIDDKYVWRNMDNSFWALPINYQLIGNIRMLSEDKLAALMSLKNVLEANGCQFIVSLVPSCTVIAARVINSEFRNIPDYQTATIVKQLSEAGIETIYASDSIIVNYDRFPFAFFYPHNGHPSDTCQDILSDLLAERLKRYNFQPTLKASNFSIVQSPHVYRDSKEYLWPENCDIADNVSGTVYTNQCVMYNGNPVNPDPQSPVLIIGNSYIQTPMNSPDSLPTLLSLKLGMGISSYRIGGHGPMTAIIQNLFSNPQYFMQGKKVVIWQIGSEHGFIPIEWNNLAKMDDAQLLMHGKRLVSTVVLTGADANEVAKLNKNKEYIVSWNRLTEKNEFICSEPDKDFSIANIDLLQCDTRKNITIAILTAVFMYDDVSLSVNGVSQKIPAYYSIPRWQNVYFEIPAGTKSVNLKAKGKKDSLFAIKNIMIYQ